MQRYNIKTGKFWKIIDISKVIGKTPHRIREIRHG